MVLVLGEVDDDGGRDEGPKEDVEGRRVDVVREGIAACASAGGVSSRLRLRVGGKGEG